MLVHPQICLGEVIKLHGLGIVNFSELKAEKGRDKFNIPILIDVDLLLFVVKVLSHVVVHEAAQCFAFDYLVDAVRIQDLLNAFGCAVSSIANAHGLVLESGPKEFD